MTRERRRRRLKTLILIGEGPCDSAFLKHLKFLYSRNTGQKVTIDSADGGSPNDVIKNTIQKCRHIDYDHRAILLDSDVVIRQQDRDLARQSGIQLIVSKPVCLEGMLLNVLDIEPEKNNKECKSKLHRLLNGPATDRKSYANLFTAEKLNSVETAAIVELLKLL